MWNPFAGVVETWRQLFNPSIRQAWHLNLDTSCLVADGHFLEASAVGARALALNEALYGPTHPQIASALENLAFALDGLENIEQAKPLFERARAMYEACYGLSHSKVARTLNSLGRSVREMGDLPAAKEHYERAVVLTEREYAEYGGDQYPFVAMCDRLDRVRQKLGDSKGAHALLTRATVLKEREAEATRVSEVQNLGKVQHQGKALSYTLH